MLNTTAKKANGIIMFEKIVTAFAITCCTVISDAVLAQEPLNLVETQIYGTQTSVTPTTTTTTTTVSVWKVPLRKTIEEEPELNSYGKWLKAQGKLEECPINKPSEIDPETYIEQLPTLEELVNWFFPKWSDRQLFLRIAFCESSAKPTDKYSTAVNKSSGASGWFQHLPKFWFERTERSKTFDGFHILDPVANVGMAAWLYFNMDGNDRWGGASHWYPSRRCWGGK